MKLKLTYFFLISIAAVVGHFLGASCAATGDYLIKWLGLGLDFGFDTVNFNLNVIKLTLGLHININILQLMLVTLAIILAPKVSDKIK